MKNVRNWYESRGLKQKQQVGFSLRGLQLIKTLNSCYCYDKPVWIYFTNGLWKLTKQAITKTHCEKTGWSFCGTTPWRIRNFFILSMDRSTWILCLAISFVKASSCGVNLCLDPKKGGIISFTCLSFKSSLMRNPRSAISTSPGFKKSKKPDTHTISLSLILPSYASLTKRMAPLGAIATKNLYVVCPLYEEYWFPYASKLPGDCTWTSVQSIMQRMFLYFLKHFGRCCLTLSLVENIKFQMVPNCLYKSCIHVKIIVETWRVLVLKRYAKSWWSRPSLSLIRVKNNSFCRALFVFFLVFSWEFNSDHPHWYFQNHAFSNLYYQIIIYHYVVQMNRMYKYIN